MGENQTRATGLIWSARLSVMKRAFLKRDGVGVITALPKAKCHKQVADLIVDLCRIGERFRDRRAHQLAVSLTHAIDCDRDGALGGFQDGGGGRVIASSGLAG